LISRRPEYQPKLLRHELATVGFRQMKPESHPRETGI